MRVRKLTVGCVLGMLLAVAASPCDAQITDDQARQSIQRAQEFLKSQQKANGSWPEIPLYAGGVTSLVTLALLSSGVEVSAPEIQKSLSYLRTLGNPEMVYSTSLQTMVFCAAEPNRDRPMIARNVKWLEEAQVHDGDRKGCWGYSRDRGGGDNSNAQFALLGLHEAERIGVKVNPETWRFALDYWLRTQRDDGSWGYTPSEGPLGSMTCAGIASVIICSGRVNQGDASVEAGRVQCCGSQTNNDAVERGLAWLGKKFSVTRNPSSGTGGRSWHLYYLYGLERVGRMSGRRFIGEHDWFREGAEVLVAMQDDLRGFWAGVGQENTPTIGTALALLFLAKGRRPIVVSKVQFDAEGDWNRHRASVQNLTQRVEQRWKRDLSWQTVDLRAATADDLAQSPVLFLSGRDGLKLSAEQDANLKQFVERGGFIFAEACCGGTVFDQDFRALVKRLFPDSQLRLLPADHPIWFAEQKVDPNFMKPLYGVDACCRTSIVYCPQDLSCLWELSHGARESTYSEPVQKEIEASLRIGANVLTYATNRELKNKLDRQQVAASDGRTEELERGTLYVPKLQHRGGSDDAPNALPNMLTFSRTQAQMRIVVENRLLAPDDPKLLEYPLVYLHGRRTFRFSAVERKALATFVERGGLIFGDAICASPEFTESFRNEMAAIFPGRELTRIAPDHPMFTATFRGFDLPRVTLRDPQVRSGEDPLRANLTQVSPVLEAVTIEDRLAVVFSPFDLSCALENGASLECKGYVKEDAARLATNVILFALQQ